MDKPDISEAWKRAKPDTFEIGHLSDDSEVVREILAFPWETTSLGPMATWPLSLRNTLRLVLTSRQTMCFWWGPDLISFHNDAYVPILGLRAKRAIGRPFVEVWPDVWEGVLPFVQEALSGRPTWMEDLPLVMRRNGYDEETWWTFSYSPLFDDAGRVAGILNIVTETTKAVQDRMALTRAYEEANTHLKQRERYEEQLRLLNHELAHRMKNTLAMTTSIVSQTLKDVPFAAGVKSAILGRVTALSKAQDLLTSTSWSHTRLIGVLEAALAPHVDRPDRFTLTGEDMMLSAQRALSLALSIHELSTNAAKYGALANPEGRILIRWTVEGDAFSLIWIEQGGPAVTPPLRTGFGSRILRQATPAAFNGVADMVFEPGGLHYTLKGTLGDD